MATNNSGGRSSPLMQLFQMSESNASADDKNDNNNGGGVSLLMRSLSKCFDPPLEEAVVEDSNGLRESGTAGDKAGKGEFT